MFLYLPSKRLTLGKYVIFDSECKQWNEYYLRFIFQVECISYEKDEKILQIRIDEATIEIFEKDLQISALRLVKPSVKKTYLTYIKTRAIDNELIIKAITTVY